MRGRILILVAALGGLASACATAPAPVSATLTATTAAPAPIDGYDWFLNREGGEASLVYGLEASDDVRLGLSCAKNSGRVEVTAHGTPGGPAEIHLESGGETERLTAKSEPSGLSDDDLLTAMTRADAPVMQRFRRLGWLAQWRDGAREAYAPHAGSMAGVEQFFGHCG